MTEMSYVKEAFCTNYSDLKDARKFTQAARSVLRYSFLELLITLQIVRGGRELLNKPRVQFLYLHHVFDDEEDAFRLLIEKLAKYYEIISYSQAIDKILSGNIDKPYLAFSFDDGLLNNLTAAKILQEYGVSACFFINPCFAQCKDIQQIYDFCMRIEMPLLQFLDWQQINQIQNLGHEIGSHSMEHLDLAVTNADRLTEDINLSYEIIKTKCGGVKHFAFPYGRFYHFNEFARQEVFKAGFLSCASAERGCHIPGVVPKADELCIRRDVVIARDKLRHLFYFMINNSRNAKISNNYFPYVKA